MDYSNFIGYKVIKKSKKPFKSQLRINTVKGIIDHPRKNGSKAFIFFEDNSYVNCELCELYN